MQRSACRPETAPGPGADFEAAVFAGGGCRCFWQAGFWMEAAPAAGLAPRVVGAVSAGAAMACGLAAGVMTDVVADFKRRAAANPRNVYPANWLRGRAIFPHEEIYREVLLGPAGADVVEKLHRGPEIRVLVGRPPDWAGPAATLLLGLVGERAESLLGGGVHARWGRRLGFRPEIVSVRSCRTAAEVAELILHSSCTPPALPLYRRHGRPVLDGGIIDAVPVEAVPEASRVLVLLTRQWPAKSLPRVPGRTYVQPSAPIPVSTWDYTDPAAIQATFDLGRRDGERFARALEGGLSADAAQPRARVGPGAR